VSVDVCSVDCVPTCWAVKFLVVGLRLTVGGVAVVKPFVCVKPGAARADPVAVVAAVVTRSLYVVELANVVAGVAVNVVFPALGVSDVSPMQVVKPSLDNCNEPEHPPFDDCTVIVEAFTAVLNVTATLPLAATAPAESAGVVETTLRISGAKASPRKAVFVELVASCVGAAVGAAL
jgi:hypothetical protein